MNYKEVNPIDSDDDGGYAQWRAQLHAMPGYQELYDEEAAKLELWTQLAAARQATGLTQAEIARRLGVTQSQVSRIEKAGYDAYTLNTLRRYLAALGGEFQLEVRIKRRPTTSVPMHH